MKWSVDAGHAETLAPGGRNILADRIDEVLLAWPVAIATELNRKLPGGYFAAPSVPAGGRPRENGEHTVLVYGPDFDANATIRIWQDGPRFVVDVNGEMKAVHPGEVPPTMAVPLRDGAEPIDLDFAATYGDVCRGLRML